MHALVTGGGGFLGRYIVEQLLARGARVRIFSRGQYPDLAALGVDVHRGDLRDLLAVRRACAGVEAVFHVAALPGVWGPWQQYYDINTLGTQHVLQASLDAGVSRLIYTSSPSVVYDGSPHINADETLPYPRRYLCHYPHTKALAERAVLAANGTAGMATCALRPHLIWGPRDNHLIPRLLQRARSGRLVQVGDGKNLVSMAYVENAAAAHILACDQLALDSPLAGQAYFINEPEPVNLWGWINDILQLAGMPAVKRSISAGAAWLTGGALEGIWTVLPLRAEPPLTRFVASQLSQSHTYSMEKARRDFGYVPLVSLDDAMQRLAPFLKQWAQT